MTGLGLPEQTPELAKKNIVYAEIGGLINFACRMVIEDEKISGEYHLKCLRHGLDSRTLIAALNSIIDVDKIYYLDPDGLLKLEYPVCMQIDSIISNDIIEDSLKEVDKFLEKGVV
jgi:hypothetical protein